jgi:hypothetical protein
MLERSSKRLAGAAALAVGVVLLVAAAGNTAAATSSRSGSSHAAPTAAERRMAAIVHEWSDRLNARDFAGIARLFALPATLIQGPYEYRLPTRHDVALWHSELPCGGKILRIIYSGRFATAVFRLSNRGKTKCDAPGALAAARFEIVGGKIVSWQQVAVPAKQKQPVGPVA